MVFLSYKIFVNQSELDNNCNLGVMVKTIVK